MMPDVVTRGEPVRAGQIAETLGSNTELTPVKSIETQADGTKRETFGLSLTPEQYRKLTPGAKLVTSPYDSSYA